MLPGAGTGAAAGGKVRPAGSGAAGADPAASAGTGPGAWWLRRVAQVGAGKVFGSAGFVLRTASALGDRFRARGVGAHPVGEIGFSTHGWRLATAGA